MPRVIFFLINFNGKIKMQIVKLASGKTVDLIISMGSVMDVKSLLGYSLLEVEKGGGIEKLLDNQLDLCNVLFVLCKKSCEAKGITDVDFGHGMDGDKFTLATNQFLEELKNFLPLHRRTILNHSLSMMAEMQKTLTESSIKKLNEMKPEMMKMIQKEMDERLNFQSLEISLSGQPQS